MIEHKTEKQTPEELIHKVESAYADRMINTLIEKWGLGYVQARDIGRDFLYNYVAPVYELGGQFGLQPFQLSELREERDTLKQDYELLKIHCDHVDKRLLSCEQSLGTAHETIDSLREENERMKTTLVAGAELIKENWDKLCDEDGYGPQNLLLRMDGTLSTSGYSGYSAGNFAKQGARIAQLESALRMSDAWPLHDVIQKLVDGVDILLHKKDYDALGWEEYEHAFTRGKEIVKQLKALSTDAVNEEPK
jgi:hypothetical protein